jgi:hypothetical protein
MWIGSARRTLADTVINLVLSILVTVGLAAGLTAVSIGWLRNRRNDYSDITAAEVNTEVAAGEALLEDVLRADAASGGGA